MRVSYEKPCKLLVDKDMNKTDFRRATGVCSATIARTVKGGDVAASILSRMCKANIGGIADFELNSEKLKEIRDV